MNATDSAHLKKAVEQLQIFLLSGLIAQSDEISLSPAFIDTTTRMLSSVMEELFQVSAEAREEMPNVKWDYVEKLRHPEKMRNECLLYPEKMSHVIRKDSPELLEILKKTMKS